MQYALLWALAAAWGAWSVARTVEAVTDDPDQAPAPLGGLAPVVVVAGVAAAAAWWLARR